MSGTSVATSGQSLLKTSEPCGKRSFLGRWTVGTSVLALTAAARVVRHDNETRNVRRTMEVTPRSPLKTARTILTVPTQVKISGPEPMRLICLVLLRKSKTRRGPIVAPQHKDAIARALQLRGRCRPPLLRPLPQARREPHTELGQTPGRSCPVLAVSVSDHSTNRPRRTFAQRPGRPSRPKNDNFELNWRSCRLLPFFLPISA